MIALDIGGEPKQLAMVFRQSLEMRLDRASDLSGVLHRQEMPDHLAVVLRLPRQAKHRVLFLPYFRIGHDLNLLDRLWRLYLAARRPRHLAIHQGGRGVERTEQCVLDRPDIVLVGHWICPDPGDLPNVNLSIGYYVASGGC